MVTVWVPALMRDLTGGQEFVALPAATVAQVVERLEERYPGISARLLHEGRVRPGLAVVIDGEVSRQGLRQRLPEGCEVHFLPALSGGRPHPSGARRRMEGHGGAVPPGDLR